MPYINKYYDHYYQHTAIIYGPHHCKHICKPASNMRHVHTYTHTSSATAYKYVLRLCNNVQANVYALSQSNQHAHTHAQQTVCLSRRCSVILIQDQRTHTHTHMHFTERTRRVCDRATPTGTPPSHTASPDWSDWSGDWHCGTPDAFCNTQHTHNSVAPILTLHTSHIDCNNQPTTTPYVSLFLYSDVRVKSR